MYFKRNIRNDSIRIWPSGARYPLSLLFANTQYIHLRTHKNISKYTDNSKRFYIDRVEVIIVYFRFG